MFDLRCPLIAFMLVAAAAAAVAQDHPPHGGAARSDRASESQQENRQSGAGQESGPGVLSLLPGDAVTEHSIDLNSGKLAYTATAGTFSLFDQSGERSAEIFYTAFVAKTDKQADKPSARPVTFVFNGGPGAASAFLNLGLVGPRIAEFGDNGRDGSQVRLVDNPDTWLAFTDLVLIDPVGTGWSRAANPDDGRNFWSVHGDAETMAKVIALYVAKNSRASSPKFILGESYGGFRAAKVARTLQSDQGIVVSGILMVSPMLEGAFQFGGDRFALGAALQLPSLAAAELERKGTFSKEALAPAEHFALTDYLTTLAGPPLAGRCGEEFLCARRKNDRPVGGRGGASRAASSTTTMSRTSPATTRSSAVTTRPLRPTIPIPKRRSPRGPDPILDGMVRAYGSAFVGYARDELGFKTEMTYNLLDAGISNKWDWRQGRRQPSVVDDLRVLLALTPSFRLMIAHGYSDMVTPYAVTRYVLQHLPPFRRPKSAPN